MIRSILVTALTGMLMVVCTASVHAITCRECRRLEGQMASIERQISEKDQEISKASEEKKFQGISDTRKQITELRQKFNELHRKTTNCKEACKPLVVKEHECTTLRAEIKKQEELPSDKRNAESLDRLYRNLSRCNKELDQLRRAP